MFKFIFILYLYFIFINLYLSILCLFLTTINIINSVNLLLKLDNKWALQSSWSRWKYILIMYYLYNTVLHF